MVVVLPVRERDGLGVGMGVGGGLSPDKMLSAFIAGAYPQESQVKSCTDYYHLVLEHVHQAHHVAVAKTWGNA
jgi:hypothetical protein